MTTTDARTAVVDAVAADLDGRARPRTADHVRVPALFNADGTLASTHYGWNRWGPHWRLNDTATARYGRRFLAESKAKKPATRNRYIASRGFRVGIVTVRNRIDVITSDVDDNGLMTAYIATTTSG